MHLTKQPKAKVNSDTYKEDLGKFREHNTELFDIVACKREFISCKCEKIRKVYIGNVDIIMSKQFSIREERKA